MVKGAAFQLPPGLAHQDPASQRSPKSDTRKIFFIWLSFSPQKLGIYTGFVVCRKILHSLPSFWGKELIKNVISLFTGARKHESNLVCNASQHRLGFLRPKIRQI